MVLQSDWKVPPAAQPRPENYDFDLDAALSAVVSLRASVPGDAFTAETLGTERAGNGVLIRADGLVLTIGYLITEAETIWLGLSDGRVIPGHALAYDQVTGFGLVQALGRPNLTPLALGQSAAVKPGDAVVVAGAGGRAYSLAAQVVAKQEFAGYWEYLLDEAIFTAPGHPHWGGAALLGRDGDLLGIGSLQLEGVRSRGQSEQMNMIVPIDLLKPVLDDLLAYGRPNRPPRPWLGVYATEIDGKVVVAGLAEGGPAARSKLRSGDIVRAVGGARVTELGDFFRCVWALGEAGVEVPVTVNRGGRTIDLRVPSADRARFLKAPRVH